MLTAKFTLKQLISLNAHIGNLSNLIHHNAGQYIVGRYGNVILLNLNLSLLYLRRSINLIDQIILSEGKFLLVSSDLSFRNLLKTRMRSVSNYSYSLGWVGGLLTNFKEIRHFFIQKNRYKLTNSSKFSNLEYLSRVPVTIFSLGIKMNPWVQQEALCLNIPFVSLVDSDVNPVGIAYAIPGNDESINFIYFLVLIISGTSLISHCTKAIRFRLKVLSKLKSLNNNF